MGHYGVLYPDRPSVARVNAGRKRDRSIAVRNAHPPDVTHRIRIHHSVPCDYSPGQFDSRTRVRPIGSDALVVASGVTAPGALQNCAVAHCAIGSRVIVVTVFGGDGRLWRLVYRRLLNLNGPMN